LLNTPTSNFVTSGQEVGDAEIPAAPIKINPTHRLLREPRFFTRNDAPGLPGSESPPHELVSRIAGISWSGRFPVVQSPWCEWQVLRLFRHQAMYGKRRLVADLRLSGALLRSGFLFPGTSVLGESGR
jgi:hypothetical protein